MKTTIIIVAVTLLILIGGVWLLTKGSNPNVPESEVIARNGIHWHPKLHLYVHGESMPLEDGIGLGAIHQPIHTHSEDWQQGVIHMEISGVVTKDKTLLGNFFRIWGKDFNWGDYHVTMTVNGQPNTDLANYPMQDGDDIVIRYE